MACTKQVVPTPDNGKGDLPMFCAFLISVVAGVVVYFICKWLEKYFNNN
jgi:hypothetical protein